MNSNSIRLHFHQTIIRSSICIDLRAHGMDQSLVEQRHEFYIPENVRTVIRRVLVRGVLRAWGHDLVASSGPGA